MLYMLVHALKREKEFLYKFQCYHSLSLSHSHTDIHIFLLLLFIFLNRMFSIYSTIYAYILNLNHRNLLYVWIKWSYWKINFIMKKRMTAFGLARLFFVSQSKHNHLSPWMMKRASIWCAVFRAALLECLRDRQRNRGRKRKTEHFARKLKTPRGRREATIGSDTLRSALGSARSSLT